MEDVKVAILQRQVDPTASCAMTFGDSDTRFRNVMGNLDRAERGFTVFIRIDQILQTGDYVADRGDVFHGRVFPHLSLSGHSSGLSQLDPLTVVE